MVESLKEAGRNTPSAENLTAAMPLVTVIIPTWNRAASLRKAIESAIAQTGVSIEILVCDDGSTDGSREVVEAIGDPRVFWINGFHAGYPAVPRNRGIRASRGEWIAFLDSDDEWYPTKLKEQLEFAVHGSLSAVCSNAVRVDPARGPVGNLISFAGDKLGLSDLLYDNRVITSSVLVRREALLSAEGFPEKQGLRIGEDYALWLRLAFSQPFGLINKPLVNYFDSPQTSVRRFSPSAATQRRRAVFDFLGWNMTKGFSQLLIAFCVTLGPIMKIEMLGALSRVRGLMRHAVAKR